MIMYEVFYGRFGTSLNPYCNGCTSMINFDFLVYDFIN